jgi:hypothetical protein
LVPLLGACEALVREEPINIAVLGQFKSVKSSLLNAVLGEIADARQIAPRVVVVETKVDLLTATVRDEVIAFLDGALRDSFGAAIPVLPFSCRDEPERWVRQLRESVLLPLARNVTGERQAARTLKLTTLARACRSYLSLAIVLSKLARTQSAPLL